ncbi:MAG: hypothetical protein WBP64_11725 [Nitrososphaeraceae archaeon]|jgi:hypothetical protein
MMTDDRTHVSLGRFVKAIISGLGYTDYSEYFIGHSDSTYWHKKNSEKRRDILLNRTLFNISKCPSTRKARCRYTDRGGRIRRIKSISKPAR